MAAGAKLTRPPGLGTSMSRIDARRAAMLVKPRKRTPAELLPSALHLSFTAAASLAVVCAIFIIVTVKEPPRKAEVLNGCSLAAVTISLIAMPELGHSIRRSLQRILGVMIGGWLFCGLYLAYQQWWFLALCLGVFTFAAVASSHWIVGKEAMYPPMVVAAFVVCVGFDSPQAAVVGTITKTCGIGAGILVYALLSSVIFPRTATQEVMDTLGLALQELRDMANMLLRKSGERKQAAEGKGKKSAPGSAARQNIATLAATIPQHLREVQALLPATAKETFLGRMPGGIMCYMPLPRVRSNPFAGDVLAVVHVAHLVHRALWLLMDTTEAVADDGTALELGSASLLDRRVPAALGSEGRELLAQMGDEAVAALTEFAATLPRRAGPSTVSVGSGHVERYASLCERLYRVSLALHGRAPSKAAAPAAGARARWRRAIAQVCEVNAAKRGAQGALRQLVGGMLERGDVDATRWCATLLLLQQLGVGLWRLQDCLGVLLPRLPGAGRLAPPAQPASGVEVV